MINYTSTTTLEPAAAANLAAFYDRTLLERAVAMLLHDRFGKVKVLPLRAGRGGHGKSMTFRKFNALPHNTTPLIEGVTPPGKKPTISDVKATIKQYGDYMPVTDMVTLTEIDPILQEFAEMMGEQGGHSIDKVYRNILNAGTNVIYNRSAGVVGRTDVDRRIDDDANPCNMAIRALENENARKITKRIAPTTKISTVGVRATFPCITGPYVKQDLEGLTAWVFDSEYATYGDLMPGEFGAYKDLRFLSTTQAKSWQNAGDTTGGDHDVCFSTSDDGAAGAGVAVDVYSIIVFGDNAYSTISLGRSNVENIIQPPTDPLHQMMTTGWKIATTGIILQQLWMLRIETGATYSV